MTRVDLITGFLGAGKTTFIHRYLHHLRGEKVLVIENEFGSIGVDAQFLRDEGCPIEDLSGVCMCCRGRDQFIGMLARAGAYDRVVVEPSGIYDVDEFFSVMAEPAVKAACEIGCVVAVVDAHAPEKLSAESAYLMITQLLAAGTVVVSKGFEGMEIGEWTRALVRSYGGELEAELCVTPWDELTAADFVRFQQNGFRHGSHARMALSHEDIYETFFTAPLCPDVPARIAELMAQDGVLRAKGYLRDTERNYYQVNCTPWDLSVVPAPDVKRGLLVIIGQHLDEDALQAILY